MIIISFSFIYIITFRVLTTCIYLELFKILIIIILYYHLLELPLKDDSRLLLFSFGLHDSAVWSYT